MKWVEFCFLSLLSAAHIVPSFAQSHNVENHDLTSATFTIDPLNVTARKREESATSIPSMVAAFSRRDIELSRYQHIGNVGDFDPALTYIDPANPSQTAFIIRGVFGGYEATEYAASMFVDGVYQGADFMYTRDLFDIERIEIMKGPQTALYGKSSIGGAISVITRDPSDVFEFSSKTTVGTEERFQESMVLNLPIVPGVFSARAAWHYSSSDGFIDNARNGNSLDDDEQNSFRLKFKYTPNDDLSIVASLSYRERDQGSWFHHKVAHIEDFLGQPHDTNLYPFVSLDAKAFSLTVEKTLFGDFRFTSISAWDESNVDDLADYDLSSQAPNAVDPWSNISFATDQSRESFSQEFRFASPADRKASWMVGAYFFDMEDRYGQDLAISTLIPIPSPPPLRTLTDFNTYSVFGQLIYEATEDWELSVEGRFDYDEREQKDLINPLNAKAIDFDAFSPKVTLSYQWSPETFLYGSWTKGHKAGGINQGDFPVFGDEESNAFELGYKSFNSEGGLSLNFAYFLNFLDGQHRTEFDVASLSEFVANKGEAKVEGVELEMGKRLSDRFMLSAGLVVVDNTFTDYQGFLVGPTGEVKVWDLTGNKEPFVSDYELTMGLSYSKAIGDEGVFSARLDARGSGKKRFEVFNIVEHEPYQIVNLNLRYRLNRWEFGLYVDNLFDEDYFTLYVPQYRFPFPRSDIAINGKGRSAGLSLKFEY